MRKIYLLFLSLFGVCLSLIQFLDCYAQTEETAYPEYVIEEGDFLSSVALQFSTTVDNILAINDITDVNAISIGTRIKIPSLKGLYGTIATNIVNIGDNLLTISILCGTEITSLANINRIISPTEVYIGSDLISIQNDDYGKITAIGSYSGSSSLIESSILNGLNPVQLIEQNDTDGFWDFYNGQILYGKTQKETIEIVHTVSPYVDTIEIKQLPLIQGETHVLHIVTNSDISLSGTLGDQNLRFFHDPSTANEWYAMIGIGAMTDPGLINLSISGNRPEGNIFSLQQKVILSPGIFNQEVVEGVDPATLQEDNQAIDTNLVKSLTQTSEVRSWGTMMSYPVDEPCFASAFGSRRSYNDGSFYNFHTGADFSICTATNTNIYAVADGTVLFAGELPIHGNYTVIDHGWGVYSSYSHQQQLLVEAGQTVKRGDLIGLIGTTGRSVGPHLHWEVIINSVYVNPMTWLTTQFP